MAFQGSNMHGWEILEDWHEELKRYDVVVCACARNAELLRAWFGGDPVLIHEGIDRSLFHPEPKSGIIDPNRFYIFAGAGLSFARRRTSSCCLFRSSRRSTTRYS